MPTTIFAAISDRSDVDVLEEVLADNGHPSAVEITYIYQRGDGKRSAMAEVLRAIARRLPGPDALVVFMDGDIRLPPGTFARSLPFFLLQPDLGALTTDNRGIVDGGDWAREWYNLRYAQRHVIMCSLALSRRLMVLTGRYSVIRAALATRPDFIDMVDADEVEHWRLGRIRLLSGDDKSTWFWLLKNGWRMLYVPDVQAHGFEALPRPDAFVSSTFSLMVRWYGNMLRTSGRAIALGPRRVGFFLWWCLIDQRLSMWTALVGPAVALMLTAFVRADFALVFLLWIMTTRLVVAFLLGLQHRRFSPLWPVLLYFNQTAGALLKTWISFRINQQKWTRQGISAGEPRDLRLARRLRRQSAWIHTTAVGCFIAVLSFSTGLLEPPDKAVPLSLAAAAGLAREPDDYWISAALRQAPAGATFHLPAGQFRLSDLPSQIRAARVRGQGVERSVLILGSSALARRLVIDRPPDTRLRVRCTAGRSCLLHAGGTVRLEGLSIVLPRQSESGRQIVRLDDRPAKPRSEPHG